MPPFFLRQRMCDLFESRHQRDINAIKWFLTHAECHSSCSGGRRCCSASTWTHMRTKNGTRKRFTVLDYFYYYWWKKSTTTSGGWIITNLVFPLLQSINQFIFRIDLVFVIIHPPIVEVLFLSTVKVKVVEHREPFSCAVFSSHVC